jgi:hypothetical protein
MQPSRDTKRLSERHNSLTRNISILEDGFFYGKDIFMKKAGTTFIMADTGIILTLTATRVKMIGCVTHPIIDQDANHVGGFFYDQRKICD